MTDVLGRRYWLAPTLRSVVAVATALVVTFTPDHSPEVGYLTLAAFCILSGAVIATTSWFSIARGRTRWLFLGCGALLVIAGVVSAVAKGGPLTVLLVLSSSTFAVTGVLELVVGLTNRRIAASRDWIFAGALSALFGLLVLLLPADFSLQFTGPDHIERTLTASVILVGALGAYAAILGVYLLIGGLSIKWSTGPVAKGV